MEDLRIALSLVAEGDVAVNVAFSEADVAPEEAEAVSLHEGAVNGVLSTLGGEGEFLFRGTVSGSFQNQCDRCLTDVEEIFDEDVVWTFVHGAPERSETEPADEDAEAEGIISFQGTSIDLTPAVWEVVVLAALTKHLCREDCKGLCPQCGTNWNETTCACAQDEDTLETKNKGFEGLRDLFPDLPSNEPESKE